MTNLWKKYSFVILFIVIVFTMGLFLLFSSANSMESDFVKVKVKGGDTLWEIAETYSPETKMDTLQLLQYIQKENALAGKMIKEGDTLSIHSSIFKTRPQETELAFESD